MSNDRRELFLIDGNSLAYRAFFALPETIATSKGVPTNAIFGFASMLVKILTEYGPKTTLVVWDAGMSGREEVSAEYKAGRRERPDLLAEQWPHMEPLVDVFGYRNIKVPGYEADDVIATLAGRAREQGIDVMIVTGDRDTFQLVEDARISKQLATAVRDVAIDIDLDQYLAEPPDRSRLREFFREFELRAPLERLEEALGEDGAAPRERHAEEVEARAVRASPSDLAKIEGELATLAAERAARPEDELPVGPEPPLQFAAYAGGDVLVGEAETLAAIALSWGDTPLVAHDWKTLAASEDPCEAPTLEHDTLVAAYLLDPAGRAYPLVELTDREGIGARIEGGDGLAERAVVTRALAARQRDELEREGLTRLFREVELPLVEVLIEMERAGVKLDTARLADISAKVQERIAALEREVWDLAGEEFTIGSPQQLAEVLFVKLGLSKKRRGKTGFSTDARVLQAIRGEHPIVEKVETWRELSKLESTYMDALPELVDEQSRLHTTFNQTATTTGRLSSTDPNLQNIPIRTELGREIRSCFVAEEGCGLISADYSQVELRVLAHV